MIAVAAENAMKAGSQSSINAIGGICAPWAAIDEVAGQVCAERFSRGLRAVVLTGSLAREEGTLTLSHGRWDLLGDAEFLLIFHEHARLPTLQHLQELCRLIEAGLLERGLQAKIGLSPVHPSYLRTLKPHIFAYELRTCGRVVWGDPRVLLLIPAFSRGDIPLEDAWRLLCNRMIEQLEVARELLGRPAKLPPAVLYRTVKLYLDMATSYLVFVGAFEPSYRRRAERLMELAAARGNADHRPFPLESFAGRVRTCTQIKLNEMTEDASCALAAPTELGFTFWEEAVEYARLLWRWELARLTGTVTQDLNGRLLQRWMRLQPLTQHLRGWLYALRKQGWHRSWRSWPRWGRQAWKASPRYWVYSAARELFFRLPCLLQPPEQRPQINVNWVEVRSRLPILRDAGPEAQHAEWEQLADDIVRNYQRFLVGTRS
jgi:hypothetical protein